MKYSPRHSQVIGRLLIKRTLAKIVRPDETSNTTKFILIDAVGPGAAAAGLMVGDIVVPTAMTGIVLDGGAVFRPMLEERNVAAIVTDVLMSEFVVQIDNGSEYVSIDDERAAKSYGAPPLVRELAA